MKSNYSLAVLFCGILVCARQGFSQSDCVNTLSATNLIANGDFESSLTSAQTSGSASLSNYTYKSGGASGPGTWGISQPVSSGSSYVPATINGQPADHTLGNTNGHYMLIDADATANEIAWRSTVTVQPNTTYFFSAWIANINAKNTNPSQLKFTIAGQTINSTIIQPYGPGPTATAADADHSWVQFYTSWSSGSNSGTITITMINTNQTGTGNDLALDDITFSTSCKWVTQLEKSHFPSKVSVCDGKPFTLDPGITGVTSTDKFTWTKGSPNGTVVQTGTGASNEAYTVPANTFDKYYLCYVVNSCARLDTAEIVNAPIVYTAVVTSPTQCGGNGTITLKGLTPSDTYVLTYTYGGSLVTLTKVADNLGTLTISGKKGTYSGVQVTANGCTSNKQDITLNDPSGFTIDFNGATYDPKSCGNMWTNVKIYGVNASETYTISINQSGVLSTQTVTSNSSSTPYVELTDGLGAGNYVFNIVNPDNNCPSNDLPLSLVTSGLPTISLKSQTNPSCLGNDGSITVTAPDFSSGTKYILTYTYNGTAATAIPFTASSASFDEVMSGLKAGNYTNIAVAVASKPTCTSTPVSATLTAPSPIVATLSTTSVCAGKTANVSIASGPTGGPSTTYSYVWQESTDSSTWATFSGTVTVDKKSITTPVLTATGKRYYKVTITSGTCSTPFAIGVNVNASPSISAPTTGSTCSGVVYSSGAISVSPSTGVIFDWSRATVTGISNAAGSASNVSPTSGISETLTNTTSGDVPVTYILTPKTATCSGTPFNLKVTVTQKPVLTVSDGSVCSGSAYASGAITSSPATGVTFDWKRAVVSGISNGAGSGTNISSSTGITETLNNSGASSATAQYVLSPKLGACTGTDVTFDVVVHPLPTATLSGGGKICKEASPNLSVAFTGTSPFVLSYTTPNGAASPLTFNSASGSIPVIAGKAGDYTLTKVTDGNNCAQTLTVKQTISLVPDLVYTPGTESCNYTTKEATITFSVSGGAPAYSVAPNNGAFAGATYTATFTAIGNTSWDYKVSDISTCAANTNLQAAKGSVDCACPVTALLANKSGSPITICPDGTTQVQVTLAGSTQASPQYHFTLLGPQGFSKTEANASSVAGNVYTFAVKDTGTYSLQQAGDQSCTGLANGTAKVAYFASPVAMISAAQSSFCANGTDAASIKLDVASPSKPNYTISVARTGLSDTSIVLTGSNTTFSTSEAATYTLKNLTDGNGCSATATNLTGQAVITAILPPIANITQPVSVTSPSQGTYTFNQNVLDVSAEDPGSGYQGIWDISKTSGTGTPILASATTSFANQVKGMDYGDQATLAWKVSDVSGECSDATAKLILARKNATQPLVNDDSICVSALGTYTLKGNGLVTGETATWKYIGSLPGVSVVPVAGTNGKDAILTGVAIPVNAGKIQLPFEYSVTSPVPGAVTTPDDMVLTVYELPEQATARDTTTCAVQLNLTGNVPNQPTASGLWTKQTGQGILADATQGATSFGGLVSTGTSQLTWTISNHLCGSSQKSVVVNQVGQITPPRVSIVGGVYASATEVTDGTAEPLCVGTSYALAAILPTAGLKSQETGTWTTAANTSGINITGTNPDGSSFTPTDTGHVNVTWTISTSVSGCTPVPATVVLQIHGKPVPGNITGTDPLCENNAGMYQASHFISTLSAVTYQWSTTPSGTSSAVPSTATTGSQITYVFTSSNMNLGKTDSVTIQVSATNACGTSDTSRNVVFGLTPRTLDIPITRDTLDGPTAFCASSTAVRWRLLHPQSQATYYVWQWDGQTQSSETDTSVILLQNQWAGKSSAKVKVTLANACGISSSPKAMDSVQVNIIQAVPFQVSLTPITSLGIGSNQFCVPDEFPKFQAAITQPIGIDVAPTFTFQVNHVTVQSASSLDTFQTTSHLADGDIVTVIAKANPSACVTTYSDSKEIAMEGYVYPDSIIHPSALKICEGDQIVLEVDRTKNKEGHYNDSQIMWYKDGVVQPQYTGYSAILTSPSESGTYTVAVRGSVCQHVTKQLDSTRIKIYQKPDFYFTKNPMIVEYQEGIKVPLPIVILPNVDTIRHSDYDPVEWLEDPANPATNFVPTKEEKEMQYTLTLTTGDSLLPSSQCIVTKTITVVNVLPLLIPNAFSPNGDGKNETWVIEGLGKYPGTTVKVFNRWGNVIYTDNQGYHVPWNGDHNGIPVPTGTYYYILELKQSLDGHDQERTGSLTIVR